MRVDFHCHTRKIKSGDPATREITPEDFVKVLANNQVQIAAITNHNAFDLQQFTDATLLAEKENIQIWPGIELDIKGTVSNGHCIIISNPKCLNDFVGFANDLNIDNPNTWMIEIAHLCTLIKRLDVIVIAHYGGKSHSLLEDDIQLLKKSLASDTPFFLEPANLRSAGIYYAKNLNCLIGSDVRNWDAYDGNKLPELKMPIKDYEHFLLLIKKDKQVMKTFMDSKKSDTITIKPFDDCILTLPIYNDVNVLFGGKGTGKSIILSHIKQHYESQGITDISFYNSQTKESEFKKISSITCDSGDFDELHIDDHESDFTKLKEWKEPAVTDLSKYLDWANTRSFSTLSQAFGFKNASFSSIITDQKLEEYKSDIEHIREAKDSLQEVNNVHEYLDEADKKQLDDLIAKLAWRAINSYKSEWISRKAISLEKKTIELMKKLCTSKSGVHPLPMSTGLLDTYEACKRLKESSMSIYKHLEEKPVVIRKMIGEIQGKGFVYQKKEITVNPNALKNAILPATATVKITNLRAFKDNLIKTANAAFSCEKSETLPLTLSFIEENDILSLRDFVNVKGQLVNERGDEYKPSSGEKSMLMLANSLMDEEKNMFFLDEPELSVGHDYINMVIVPRIIELAKQGKKVIICTHDANIAVRTLPLLSVYREYKGNEKYSTYIGSAFMDTLVNPDNSEDYYSWTQKSLETLEGGENAFIERNEIYG